MTKKVNILQLEDNKGDVYLTGELLNQFSLDHELNDVSNGEDALNYLLNEGEFKEAQKPDLILLDLNMPKMNGREFLDEIKKHDKIKNIPIIVTTTSPVDESLTEDKDLNVVAYMRKPIDVNTLVQKISGFTQ